MIEMTIDSIRGGLMNSQFVVILKEKMADRYLPIWIGPSEANAIAIKLRGDNLPRPLTHDLLCLIIDGLGASVDSIIVCDLKNDTFYAKIILNVSNAQVEIDSRPSDALALAVRSDVTIYTEESVLDRASILLDKETGKPIIDEGDLGDESKGKGKSRKISDEELKKLSAFRDFIDNLDLDDFDKRKS